MALIGTLVEPGGIARIFFDLKVVDSVSNETLQVVRAIERAFEQPRSTTSTSSQGDTGAA